MKISYNWLLSHIKTDLEVEKIAEILTNTGLEIEGIEKHNENNPLNGVVVGKVLELQKHPNADKLRIATVDIGRGENLQIICGAPNIKQEQKVAVAPIGVELPTDGDVPFKIKKVKLRGVESFGMICSEKELGLSENHEGIWVLEPAHQVGTPISSLLAKPAGDVTLEIGLTPNRSDAMSHFGVARDLNAALKALKIKTELTPLSAETFDSLSFSGENPIEVEVTHPEMAPRYAGLYLENIEVKPSPEWMQNRLKAIGLNPINNVVDITNYILHDIGQPLHAFDADKIHGKNIIVGPLKKDSRFTTLDETEHRLNGTELMICDEEGGMCMAGIYGGIDSGVTENTKGIFLESAYFDPVSIRKAAKFHGLSTDSSFRFERGADPELTVYALKKAAMLLIELAGAKIVGDIIDIYPKPIENFTALLRFHKLHKLAGERIHHEQVKEILKSLDIEIISESNDVLELSIPPYRADVQREIDVIEEILRIYGYNKIKTPEKISFTPVENSLRSAEQLESTAAQTLVSLGYHEVMNNSVGSESHFHEMGLSAESSVKLLNPLSSDLNTFRHSLLPGLLDNVEFNLNRKISNLKLFEFGKIYEKKSSKYKEHYRLGILISGDRQGSNWNHPSEKSDFFTLKGVVSMLGERLGLPAFKETAETHSNFSDFLELRIGGKKAGFLGRVHANILKKADISQPVYYAELNWDQFLKSAGKTEIRFREISKFPAVRRDLALLLDTKVSYSEIRKAIHKMKSKLIRSVELFDVYEGNKLPAGKKSYALSFHLQDDSKTLNDQEIDKVMSKITQLLKKEFAAELRE